MTNPITPNEIVGVKRELIPDEVIAVFNEEIARQWNGTYSYVAQDIIVSAICKRMSCAGPEVYNNNWLDVEPIYRAAGWNVSYKKPDPGSNSSAIFTFSVAQKESSNLWAADCF